MDSMPCDPFQGQGHLGLKIAKMVNFKVLAPSPLCI